MPLRGGNFARRSGVNIESRLTPTATRGNQSSYTTLWDTTGATSAPDLDTIGQGVYVPNEVVQSTGPLPSTGGGARFIVDHG